jgi:multicomponent Na+:H+ antiporter subunit D
MSSDLLLILALGAPFALTFAIIALNRLPDVREAATLITAVFTFVICATIAVRVGQGVPVELFVGSAAPGLDFAFKVEPLGAMFACIASGLWILNSLYSIGYMRAANEKNQTRFYACFAIAITGAIGVATAENLFTLFVFYEILTLSTYPLVTHKGDEAAKKGGKIYLLTLLGTSIGLFLVGIIITYSIAGSVSFVPGGLLDGMVGPGVASLLVILFAFGVGKAALMPFHFWLPNAMVAPTPVSALLHAVAVVKAGVFTLLKIGTYIFGVDLLAGTPATEFVLIVGCITILGASLIALTKDNLKARLAYSTVSQLAYVTVGVMLADAAGLLGGGLQIASHAVAKITLFMCAGAIYIATGKTEISQMRGLGRRMPIVFTCFLIASLSIIGVPPLAGDWPKYELMQGAIDADHAYVVYTLIISSILNVAYLIPISILALMPPVGSPEPAPFKRPGGAPALTVFPIMVTAAGCFLLFFMVDYVSDFLQPVFGSRM